MDTFALSLEGLGPETAVEHSPAFDLDSRLARSGIPDVTYAESMEWVCVQIAMVDQADAAAVEERIRASTEKLEDNLACAIWPHAAHAHLQIIQTLSECLVSEWIAPEDRDMSIEKAAAWAQFEVQEVDLRDPFAIADRIGHLSPKLADPEKCRQSPGSAFAIRSAVCELSSFLHRTRGTVH